MSDISWELRGFEHNPHQSYPANPNSPVTTEWRTPFLQRYRSLTPYLSRLQQRREGFLHTRMNAQLYDRDPHNHENESLSDRYQYDLNRTHQNHRYNDHLEAVRTYNLVVNQLNQYELRRRRRATPDQNSVNQTIAREQPIHHNENTPPIMEQSQTMRYL